MKKYLHLAIAAVFLLFAYFQWNDPDPLRWMLVYGAVAVFSVLAATGRHPRVPMVVVTALIAVWAALLSPGFVHWVGEGMPSITGSMKAGSPHIEVVREFLGLVIALAAMVHLLSASRRARV